MTYGIFAEAFGRFADELYFLSRALGHDETRPMLHHLVIEPSEKNEGEFRGLASDGYRLHIVDPLSCPNDAGIDCGRWRFLGVSPKPKLKLKRELPKLPKQGAAFMAKITLCDIPPFPDYGKKIPSDRPLYETAFQFNLTKGMMRMDRVGQAVTRAAAFTSSFPEPTTIKPRYIIDLGTENWHVSWYGQTGAVVFESDNRKAV